MLNIKMNFQPKWKEELVCSCELGEFVLEMPMGDISVCFPSEEVWLQSAPFWAASYWASIHSQLQSWCAENKIPLYVDNYAKAY